MRNEKLNFGVIIRVFISLIPLFFGLPSLAIVMCAYNILMSFVVLGALPALVSALAAVCIAMFVGQFYGNAGALSGMITALQAAFSSLGFIYGYLLKRKFSYGLTLGTAGMLLPQFFFVKTQAEALGISVAQSIVPDVEDIKEMLGQTFSQLQPAISEVQLNEISTYVSEFTTMLIPSVFIISSLVLAYAVIWAVSLPLNKINIGLNHSFALIKIPKVMSAVFIALFVCALATAGTVLNEYLLVLLINMIIILAFICFSAGLSVAEFFFRKFIKFTLVRVVFHITLLFVVPLIPVAYIIIACIDSFVNFRKINPVNNTVKKGEHSETEK